MTAPLRVLFNPACSKCRRTRELLDARGVRYELVEYLKSPPSADELRAIAARLPDPSPRTLARTKDPAWADLGGDELSDDEVFAALAAHPALIERPVLVAADRALVARPPELLESWL